MSTPRIGTRDDWLTERLKLLAREKELNRLRDALAEDRRKLPWVPIEKDYAFEGPDGRVELVDLFDGRGQLLVYHFMFGPDWDEGCPSCSFWADSFDGLGVHLAQRDVTLVCISRASYSKLAAYRERMGWSFPWFSSAPGDFSADFHVSFTPDQQRDGGEYNFVHQPHPPEEAPGLGAFASHDDRVFHTYSTYARGLDPINSAYQLLDLAPRGRDEGELEYPMAWLRRHDQYG